MKDLDLTTEQVEVLSRRFSHLDPEGKPIRPIALYSYTDWLCKVTALVKLSREAAYGIANGNLDEGIANDIYNTLEVAESLLDMFEDMEVLDGFRTDFLSASKKYPPSPH